ncbi:hypothetical protein HUG17_0550 [Dermatophagoides farinae]|uniref:Uncharacterized protein n=1 Tax=Dermatophagoides farinae TaxID=6954 RepID=A0A9D4P752_DERFA|nr:hypothetical protein HUG17_0550 [Dermatophagoides farinae]
MICLSRMNSFLWISIGLIQLWSIIMTSESAIHLVKYGRRNPLKPKSTRALLNNGMEKFDNSTIQTLFRSGSLDNVDGNVHLITSVSNQTSLINGFERFTNADKKNDIIDDLNKSKSKLVHSFNDDDDAATMTKILMEKTSINPMNFTANRGSFGFRKPKSTISNRQ